LRQYDDAIARQIEMVKSARVQSNMSRELTGFDARITSTSTAIP